jgi:hypothetical protein
MSIAIGVAAYQSSQADVARAQTALSDLKRETAQAITRESEKVREKETAMRADAESLRSKLAKEIDHAKTRQDRLLADIRAGTERLSIPAACPASQAATDPGAAPGSGAAPQRAELDQSAAETLVAIASDGDQAIRERNACIEQYNAVRESLNTR